MADLVSFAAELTADLQKAAADLAAAQAAQAPAPVTAAQLDAIVEPLFVQYAHGTVLSRDTDVYNQAYAFKQALKARLLQELSP